MSQHWELVGEAQGERTVAGAAQDGDIVSVVVGGRAATCAGSLEDAVRSTPELTTLAPGIAWSLTTDLDPVSVATLLGRPPEGVDRVVVNGEEWWAESDEVGPYLMSDSWPADDDFLCIFLKNPGSGSPGGSPVNAWWFERTGPLCRVSSVEVEEERVIYEPDDFAAVERLTHDVWGPPIAQIKGDLVNRLDAEGRQRLVNSVSSVESWPVWWLGTELWSTDGPLPTLPLSEVDLAGALIEVGDDAFRVGAEEPDVVIEVGARRFIMVPPRLPTLEALVTAVFTSNDDEDDGHYESVQLRPAGSGAWVGLEVYSEDLQLRLAKAFGALALIVGGARVAELRSEGARQWSLTEAGERSTELRVELPEVEGHDLS